MKVSELISRLQEFPPDWDAAVTDEGDGVCEIEDVEAWLHFQTEEPMGAVLLLLGEVL